MTLFKPTYIMNTKYTQSYSTSMYVQVYSPGAAGLLVPTDTEDMINPDVDVTADPKETLKLAIRGVCLAIDNTVYLFKSRNITPTVRHGRITLPTYNPVSMERDICTYCQCLTSIQDSEDLLKRCLIYDKVYSNIIESVKHKLLSAMIFTSGKSSGDTVETDKQILLKLAINHQNIYQSCVLHVFESLKQYLKDLTTSLLDS